MVDDDDAILELGGQVEGEARSWQTRSRRRDPLQHIVHDVITVTDISFIVTGWIIGQLISKM